MLLANKHFTPVVGLDIHIVTLPIGPIPLPHPFIGLVVDPMDYVPFIGSSVKVNGVPRGIADTSGMMVTLKHIPMGGPWPMVAMIAHDSVNFFGSLKVKAEDVALSPAGYMAMTCNDIGMPLSLSPGKKMKPMPSMYLPTSMSIPIPLGKPVMVGGPYAPDLLGILKQLAMSYGFGAIMKGVGALAKKALTKLNHALPKNKFTKGLKGALCKMGFEPVDLVDGRMVYEGIDFELPGPVSLKWERRWYSDSEYEGPMGHGFHHSYDLSLELISDNDVALLVLPDGRPCAFPLLQADGDSFYHRSEKLSLKRLDRNTFELKGHVSGIYYKFSKVKENFYRPTRIYKLEETSIILRYDYLHRLARIEDTAGRQVHIEHDSNDRIVKIHATKGNNRLSLIGYTYNEAGDLVGITDALGKSTKMKYQNHLMVSKTDRNGQTFYWEYDGSISGSRVVHTWGDGGLLEGWIEYRKGYNIVTNSLGHKTTYWYNKDKLCTRIDDPMGGVTTYEYTDFMEPYRNIDPEGGITGYTYDPKGNLKTVTLPDGSTSTYLYDSEDRQILAVAPDGGTTVRSWEENGLLSSVEGPDGSVTTFGYNNKGLLSEIRDNKGRETLLEYDKDLNLIETILPCDLITTWEYDDWGRTTKATDVSGAVRRFNYDDLGRTVRIHLPNANTMDLKYDAYDAVILAEDNRHTVRFVYTPLGSLKSREQKNVKVNYSYDTEGRLQSMVNEQGEIYHFARDGNGSIIKEEGYDGITRFYDRDRVGKIKRTKHSNGRVTENSYDVNGRLTRTDHGDGSWEAYSYDFAGRLVKAENEDSTVSIHRDKIGRIIKEDQDGHAIESTYDKLGQRISLDSSLGASINLNRDYLTGNVVQMQASNKEMLWNAAITHDALGREIERVVGGVRNRFSYDKGGRVYEQETDLHGYVHRQKRYEWGAGDKLWRTTDLLTKSQTVYDYDIHDNLIQCFSSTDGLRWQGEHYFRDEVGNIFNKEDKSDRKYASNGKLEQREGLKFSYDVLGNLSAKTTIKGIWRYLWKANGMLKQVERPDGKTVEFEYDALGRRTAKIFDGKITRWLWDGNRPLHEWSYLESDRPKIVVDEVGMLSKDKEEPTDDSITWVFDEGSLRPAAKIVKGETYTIITDYLGTPLEAYDHLGEKVWKCELGSYGKVLSCKGSEEFIPFRFQGQYHDIETGLYYNRFRYYSPDENLYISQDPIRLKGNNPTFYAYVKDINNTVDIFGLSPTYYPLDSLGRPTGGIAEVSESSLGTGTDAAIDPPGWEGGAHPHHQQRGHLIANNHGGSGTDERNIVAITDGTNHPGMTKMENKITKSVKEGNTVLVEVKPHYDGDNLVPSRISVYAIDQNGNVIVDGSVENGLRQNTKCCH